MSMAFDQARDDEEAALDKEEIASERRSAAVQLAIASFAGAVQHDNDLITRAERIFAFLSGGAQGRTANS